MRRMIIFAAVLAIGSSGMASARQARFEDVVRNLRNPDPRTRFEAIRLLREAKHPEAVVPLAPLVNDPQDPIQLEAIAAELSFFLVHDVPERRRLGFLEVRSRGVAATAFELGRLGVWPRPAPPELITELLKAVDDENARVRIEAIYTMGTIARAPLSAAAEQQLVKALDHYDAAVRTAAARVAGRLAVKGTFDSLLKAVNDSNAEVRYAAMRSLGMLGDDRAVATLTEQLKFYGKGEGAWSALDGLARLAHASTVSLFTARLSDKDPYLRRAAAEGLGRAGDKTSLAALESGAGTDASGMVRAAMQYALQKLGRNYVARLIEFLDDRQTGVQVQEYMVELGPAIETALIPSLQEPDPQIRAAVADVLGEVGSDASLAALRDLKDREKEVTEAAARAVERIRLRRLL